MYIKVNYSINMIGIGADKQSFPFKVASKLHFPALWLEYMKFMCLPLIHCQFVLLKKTLDLLIPCLESVNHILVKAEKPVH